MGARLETFMSAIGHQAMEMRQCAFCGKRIAEHLNQCPFCREMVPQVRLSRSSSVAGRQHIDRKSTRLNSSHTVISYAVFCLKKKTREVKPGPGDRDGKRPRGID